MYGLRSKTLLGRLVLGDGLGDGLDNGFDNKHDDGLGGEK